MLKKEGNGNLFAVKILTYIITIFITIGSLIFGIAKIYYHTQDVEIHQPITALDGRFVQKERFEPTIDSLNRLLISINQNQQEIQRQLISIEGRLGRIEGRLGMESKTKYKDFDNSK